MELLLAVFSFTLLIGVQAWSYNNLFWDSRKTSNDEDLTPRIIGGRDAEEKEFPWMASLHFDGDFRCSSFLITPSFVMTAAHCVVGGDSDFVLPAERFIAYVGTLKRDGPDTEVTFSDIIPHSQYSLSRKPFEYDIALMKLTTPVTLSDAIQPICLPESGDNYEEHIAQTMGWGVYERGGSRPAETLQTLPQRIPTNMECAMIYMMFSITITSRHVCAGGNANKGVCNGDSGGPLVSLNETRPVAIGITSFGSNMGCALPMVPGVFTAIESYLDWVKENMGENASELCFEKMISNRTRTAWG